MRVREPLYLDGCERTPVGGRGASSIPRLAPRPCALALAALLGLCSALLAAGEKERLLFRPRNAESYPARDAHEGVVAAAEPFDTPEENKSAFGKNDPLKAGFLPILLVIANNTDKTIRLDDLSVQFMTRDRQKIEPTPAEEVAIRLKKKPAYTVDPVPSPIPRRTPRRPRPNLEVLVHAFNMRMLPPRSSASGFFYFDTGQRYAWMDGSKLLARHLSWANDGQPLMDFEISLDDARRSRPRGR